MLTRLKSSIALAALAAIAAAFALTRPSASQTRAATSPSTHPGAIVTGAPAHGPTAFGFLEFDWNGALPGFSPWRGDATTAELFPQHSNPTE